MSKSSPVLVVGNHSFVEVLCNSVSVSGKKSNGEVWSWGHNAFGQLGDNTLDNKSSPILVVGNHNFAALSELRFDEHILFSRHNYIETETWCFGVKKCKISKDKYALGFGEVSIKYKTGSTKADCEADSWKKYTGDFDCLGWVKVKIDTEL